MCLLCIVWAISLKNGELKRWPFSHLKVLLVDCELLFKGHKILPFSPCSWCLLLSVHNAFCIKVFSALYITVLFLTFCTSVGCSDCQFVGLFKLSGLDVTFAFGVLEKLYDYAWLRWKCFVCWSYVATKKWLDFKSCGIRYCFERRIHSLWYLENQNQL